MFDFHSATCVNFWIPEAHVSSYALDQEHRFEHMMEALSQQQAAILDVDPDVEAFVNGLAYSLQKTTGQQCEHLFIDICQLVYDTLFPCRQIAPRPSMTPVGAKPHLGSFCPPRPINAPSVPTAHGDQIQFGHNWVLTSQLEGETNGKYLCTLQYTKL